VTIRGSGTEPKLKYYIEINPKTRDNWEEEFEKLSRAVVDNLLRPKENGLVEPA